MKATLLFVLLWRICQMSSHSRASVTVFPSRSQFFEYENISVSCEQFGSGDWTVWRYTTNSDEQVLSQCGSRWGNQTSSTCDIKTVKKADSGVYWCESKHRDSSNTVNITVTDKPVILQSPVYPLMEGRDVTLHCQTKNSTSIPAQFFKNGLLVGTELTGHMTIHRFSKSDESDYKCRIREHEESLSSWLLMKDDWGPASLTASPNSSQLFEYENLSLSCGANSSVHGWKVVRATSGSASGDKLSLQSRGAKWGTPTSFGCILQTAKKPDSGIYWCESPARQRSNSVNITVHDEAVILHSPVLPVMEGHDVILHCQTKTPPFNLPAGFYKDGFLLSTESTGHMTIHHVSRSDEGLYKCHISGRGESPPSRLFVREAQGASTSTADPTLSVLRVICHLVVFCPYCISTVLMLSLYCHRPTGRNPPVSTTPSPPSGDDEGLDHPYDDIAADVTTEHHF